MSTKIILDNIITSSAPAYYTDQISFQVTFTVLQPLPCPIAWKIIYVGSAYSEDYDQTLEEFEIDPIQTCGTMKFDIACNPPDPTKIPRKQLLCVTALLLTASYQKQQFIRVGYYVHNQLLIQSDQYQNLDQLALPQLIKKIKRTIISDKPRVTKFNIQWLNTQIGNKKKIHHNQQSQSKISDYFSHSIKSQNQYQQIESTSQKIGIKQDNEKQSTQEQNENQIMVQE